MEDPAPRVERPPTIKGSRRTHTKSRQGCFECKRRKVKCDEEKPHCSGCAKRLIPCQYPVAGQVSRERDAPAPVLRPEWSHHLSISSPYPAGISPRDHGAVPSSAASSRSLPDVSKSPVLPLPSRGVGNFGMEDMALWHQFVTATAATVAKAGEKELPLQALGCDYLMHGILATAALHLAYLDPAQQDKYNYLAAHHQDLALGPFRQAMSNITPENCNQVFAFSILMVVFNYASFRSPEHLLPFSNASSYKGLSSWVVCLRGCASIFQQAGSHIMSGPLRFLIAQEDWTSSFTAPPPRTPPTEDDESLQYLSDNLLGLPSVKSSTTVEAMEAYTDAIFRLRRLLAASSQTTDIVSRRAMSSVWAATVPDTFVWLLNEQRPPALIIMGHYCLLLKKCDACWYMEHRAYDLFEAVRQSLAEEWLPYLEHPLRVFKGRS